MRKRNISAARLRSFALCFWIALTAFPSAGLADAGEGAHCFLCAWCGRDIAPWCWVAPLALAGLMAVEWIIWLRQGRDTTRPKR